MLLIDRDTLVSDITWSALERMADSALKISTDQQAERVCTAGGEGRGERVGRGGEGGEGGEVCGWGE